MLEIAEIEEAVMAALGGMSGTASLMAHAAAPDMAEVMMLAAASGAEYPVVIVSVTGLDMERRNKWDRKEASVTVTVADRNRWDARGAAGAAAGAREALEQVRELLHGRKILAGWAYMTCRRERAGGYDAARNLCVYTAEYVVETKGA